MPVVLRSCSIGITLVPIGYDDKVLVPLASKLAKGEKLSLLEMSTVNGFRFVLNTQTRRNANTPRKKAYLVYRIILEKDGRAYRQTEVMDTLSAKIETVVNHNLVIPRTIRQRLGQWTIKVGYCAMFEDELIPEVVSQMIESLPYNYTEYNETSFLVDNTTVLPTGERSRRINVVSEMTSGQNAPDDI